MKQEWHRRVTRELTRKMRVSQTKGLCKNLLCDRDGAMIGATPAAEPR